MMQLGMDGVFVGSGIFKSQDPEARAKAIVKAVTHFNDPKVLMECSTGLGPAMVGNCDIKGDRVNFRDREGSTCIRAMCRPRETSTETQRFKCTARAGTNYILTN